MEQTIQSSLNVSNFFGEHGFSCKPLVLFRRRHNQTCLDLHINTDAPHVDALVAALVVLRSALG
eukprot:m.46235 g.46235  ORF g.46235 m.46235 type:complete len:64 (+) comp15154_c0_seq6:1326-1517(+)